MEPIEEQKQEVVPNAGLFSLCEGFDENPEEFKETEQGVDDRVLYLNYKNCILDKKAKLGGKGKAKDDSDGSPRTELSQELLPFKENILNVRRTLKIRKPSDTGKFFELTSMQMSSFHRCYVEPSQKIKAVTNIFQLPVAFYPAIMESIYFKDTEKMVELEMVAANRDDYDWMKELKQKVGQGRFISFRTFSGDIFTINKCKLTLYWVKTFLNKQHQAKLVFSRLVECLQT